MDLFEIQRYDETALQANHTEEQLLLDLQKRIKERKKKMASELTQKPCGTTDKNSRNDDRASSLRKRKNLKSLSLMPSSVVGVSDDAHDVLRVLGDAASANAEENPMTARVKKKKKVGRIVGVSDDVDRGVNVLKDVGSENAEEDPMTARVKKKKKVARVSRIVKSSPEDADSLVTKDPLDIKDSPKKDSLCKTDFPNESDMGDNNQELVPSALLGIDSSEHSLPTEVVGADEEPVAESEKSFPILGRQRRPKKGPAKSHLPRWLSDHIVVSASLGSDKRPVEGIDYLQLNTINNLRKAGISHLFPIQSSVIPYLLAQTVGSSIHAKAGLLPKDVCVQAPTGSGKTISYVIPIVEILSRASVRHLYALVVLPSKDLAIQVKKVFDVFTQGTRLKVALVSGVNSFAKEQEKLVVKCLDRYLSKVDIIVCTPGRLVDHMKQTAGFSLTKLRFLVLDEADRLLSETYNNWLEEILRRAYEMEGSSVLARKSRPASNAESMMASYSPLQKLLFSATLTKSPEKLASLCLYQPVLFACRSVPERGGGNGLQAEVCDSTATYNNNNDNSNNNNNNNNDNNDNSNNSNNNNDNSNNSNNNNNDNIDSKNNNENNSSNPIGSIGDADNGHARNGDKVEDEESLRYILPSGLKQRMIIVEAGEKPLVVLHLIASLKHTGVLCFTKSIEATHRLYLLLSEFKSIRSAEFSSSLSEVQRKGIIRDFRAGLIDVVVSSDAMARGMDLNNVSVVLNYDTATNVKTYVHRVGRTARAGAEGLALTILTFKEVYHFKQMTAKLSSEDKPTKLRVTADDLSIFVADYEKALDKLKSSVAAERKKERSGARSFRAGSSVKRTRV